MMSSEEIASYDAARRSWLDVEVAASRRKEKARCQALHPNTGKSLAQLPTNWQEIKNAVFTHIKPEHMREFLTCITNCVGRELGVTPTALARPLKISAATVDGHIRKQERAAYPWMRAEVLRIAALCPVAVFEERKAG
jgi:hypothetical protein